MGREWPNLGGLAPRHTQRPPTYRDPFFPRPCQKVTEKLTQYSYSSSCRGKHLIGNTAMDIVKFRPRWPHTWRYAHHSLLCPIMTSGCLGYSETCIKRTPSGNAVIIIGRLQSRRLRASSSHNDPVPIQTACPGQSCCLCLQKVLNVSEKQGSLPSWFSLPMWWNIQGTVKPVLSGHPRRML